VATVLGALSAVIVALSAVGCSSQNPPVSAKLAQAERAVDEAQQPGAAVRPPAENQDERDKIMDPQTPTAKGRRARAIRSADQAEDLDEQQHLGYVGERKAQLASVTGATGQTEQTLQQLGKETAEMLLKKRDRELTAARAGTDGRGLESGQVRLAAEARVREAEAQARAAEQARRPDVEAEAKARAAEQAKGAALAKELASLRAQQTDRGLVLTNGDVLFDAGKTSVGPGAQRSIDKLAEFLKTYPKRNVLIEGHSDSFGN